MANDPHRPRYHFLPPANWMNDPVGLIQWKGQYHLFYQYNPNDPFWGPMHWGHAVSPDLVHWTDLPIALSPGRQGPDREGCWSGDVVDGNGVPTAIYTGVHPQRPCLASSQDDLLTWEKYEGNPVIASPPEHLDVVGFRDHCVWKEADVWYQIIGSGLKGIGGAALLYKSKDLIHWEYLHPLYVGDRGQPGGIWAGTMWECPDFFPLGDQHVLILSAQDAEWERALCTLYFVGTYANHRFSPHTTGKIDHGDVQFYAAQTFLDDKGRRIMFGWIQESRSEDAQRAAGWAGVASLPRILSLRPDGTPGIEPAPELRVLRGDLRQFGGAVITPASPNLLTEVQGSALEISAEFDLREAGPTDAFGLKVRCSPDGAEQTSILYESQAKRVLVDRSLSSLSSDVHRGEQWGPLDLAPDENLRLHVFLDGSVLEVYANGHFCLTSRIYPSRTDSLGAELFVRRGRVRLQTLDVWEMYSIRNARR